MSDTPRTDVEAFLPHDSKYRVCDVDFVRKLERELNAANKRIKRLEEAGDEMHRWCSNPRIVGGDTEAADEWREAKEAKP